MFSNFSQILDVSPPSVFDLIFDSIGRWPRFAWTIESPIWPRASCTDDSSFRPSTTAASILSAASWIMMWIYYRNIKLTALFWLTSWIFSSIFAGLSCSSSSGIVSIMASIWAAVRANSWAKTIVSFSRSIGCNLFINFINQSINHINQWNLLFGRFSIERHRRGILLKKPNTIEHVLWQFSDQCLQLSDSVGHSRIMQIRTLFTDDLQNLSIAASFSIADRVDLWTRRTWLLLENILN